MRTEDDQWDIVSSVGWTALVVAAGRAVETNRGDGLVDDPWAETLVRRAGTSRPMPTRPGDRWPDAKRQGDETTGLDEFWALMASYQGVRSRYLDRAVLDAAARGARQVVLLAAGLDARAYRLDWPDDTTVYEIDQPGVTDYKDRVLADEGATPRATRRVVPIDLREDWVSALRSAGFDPTQPSAWLAEGLLPFLPAEAEAELLRLIGTLSAPGSSVIVEHFGPVMRQMQNDPAMGRAGEAFGVEMPELVDTTEDRPHPSKLLTAAGWRVHSDASIEIAPGYGRTLAPLSTGLLLDSEFVTGVR